MTSLLYVTGLEQIVTLGDVLECIVESMRLSRFLVLRRLDARSSANSVRIGKFSIDWSDNIALRDHNSLPCH